MKAEVLSVVVIKKNELADVTFKLKNGKRLTRRYKGKLPDNINVGNVITI